MDSHDERNSETFIHDPLLECLLLLIKIYDRHYSQEALTAGLPLVNHRLTPSLFIQAAERAGFIAKIIKRPLKKISNLVLPAVLILQNNQCCILKKWIDADTAEIILPEMGVLSSSQKSLADLAEQYSEYAILIHPESVVISTNEPTLGKNRSWFWGTLWNYRHSYSEVLLAAFFINIFALVSPLFVMNVYDRVVPNNALVTLWTLGIGVLLIFTFDLILRFLRSYLIDVAGKRADVLMASNLFQQVLTLEMRYKPRSIGSFVSNLREFESIRDFFTSATLTTLVDLPFLVLYLILIAYIGGYVVIVPLIAVVLTLLTAWLIEKPLHKIVQQALQSNAQKHAIMVESMTGLEAIKSMGAEGLIQRKWEQAVGTNARFGLKSRFLSGSVSHISYYLQQLMTIFIVIVGVYEIENHLLTLGGLIACSILSGRMMAPLSQLMSLLTRYQQAKCALLNLNKLMELPSEYSISKQFLHHERIKGDIEFHNVTFQYPDQEQTKALNNVSFKIKAGEHLAMLGRIGSGKSTLLRLLLGLYHPQSGAIYIDGIDIAQIDPADLRRNIGYVQQDVLLFAGTVRDNIVMSQPWADDKAVLQAAKISGADNFVSRHPLGYGLHIGERGEGLSGGQRQTLVIARALLSNPPLLLFDEPTSSMDEQLEQEWVAKMKEYTVGKTLLLSTHKGSLLTLADRILILENGQLVHDGTKENLIQRLSQTQRQT